MLLEAAIKSTSRRVFPEPVGPAITAVKGDFSRTSTDLVEMFRSMIDLVD